MHLRANTPTPICSLSNGYAMGIANENPTSFAYLTRPDKKNFINSHSCDANLCSNIVDILRRVPISSITIQ